MLARKSIGNMVISNLFVFGLCASPLSRAAEPTSAPPLTLQQAASAFGAREDVIHASLSPDGRTLAILEPYQARGTALKIIDLTSQDNPKAPVLVSTGDPERIEWCRWASTTRILCELYGTVVLNLVGELSYVSRILAINIDGKNMQMLRGPNRASMRLAFDLSAGDVLDWNTGKDGHVLLARDYFPEFSTGTRTARSERGLAVDDIDSSSLKAVTVERANPAGVHYLSDGRGTVRVAGSDAGLVESGYSSGTIRYRFRRPGSREWEPLASYDVKTGAGFEPHAVDPGRNLVYGLKKLDGRFAAYSLALDGTGKEELVFARPDVDIDGFVQIGRSQRVIGVDYTTESGQVDYFDPEIRRLAASLAKALPTLPIVRIIDASQDERKLLVWAGSDIDAGRLFLLDRDSRSMQELAASRRPMLNRKLAAMKPVQVKVADGSLVPAFLTMPAGSDGKNLPAIVLPHGGPSSRDKWGFDWLAQFWADRGYAVLQPNYRGSSGYGDSWFQNNGFKSWDIAIGDVIDSGRWLVEQGIADPKKLAIFGWSYGGYAALQSAIVAPDLFRAVVAVAPATDLAQLKEEWDGWSNYRVTRDFIGSGPHIEAGSPARQAARIGAPALLFHGTYDRNVAFRQSQFMVDQLGKAGKAGRLVTYDKLDHYLEDSTARADMLSQSATFLEQSFAAGK